MVTTMKSWDKQTNLEVGERGFGFIYIEIEICQ